jgi:hypothetical protein
MTTALLDFRTPGSAVYSETELIDLPNPVARYFRRVLHPGQQIITHARITWAGEFNMGRLGRDNWRPFTAVQHFVPGAPGFVWDARIMMLPGRLFRGMFVGGRGSMKGWPGAACRREAGTPTLAAVHSSATWPKRRGSRPRSSPARASPGPR